MKKTIFIILVIVELFCFCSCGLTVTVQDNAQTAKSVDYTESTVTYTLPVTEEKTVKNSNTENTKSTKVSEEEKTEEKSTVTGVQKTEQKKTVTCSVEISCKNILENKSLLNQDKLSFLPKSGAILNTTKITLPEGSTAFDAIKKACSENYCSDKCKYCVKNNIHIDYVYTPGYNSYYIRGIHQLYEKDCGPQSGWMYNVNGIFPNYGSSSYTVKNGDVIKFMYTCDLGEDIGG